MRILGVTRTLARQVELHAILSCGRQYLRYHSFAACFTPKLLTKNLHLRDALPWKVPSQDERCVCGLHRRRVPRGCNRTLQAHEAYVAVGAYHVGNHFDPHTAGDCDAKPRRW